jgi:uncharacterized protein YkwD
MPSRFLTRRLAFLLYVVSATGAFAPAAAVPDVLGDLNTVRTTICGRGTPGAALHVSPAVNSAAQRVARGATPQDALLAVGYVAKRVAAIHLEGYTDDAQIRQALARESCSLIADPRFHDVGIGWNGNHLWLVLAAARGVPGDADAVSERVLSLVNEARSRQRRCGAQSFATVKPLTLNAKLGRAALLHSQDMATHSFMAHEGDDGSTPEQRVTRVGYQWAAVGENVAAGAGTAEEVMADWLASPGHCANIMGAQYRELGIAFAVNSHDNYGVYWTMSLAAPR